MSEFSPAIFTCLVSYPAFSIWCHDAHLTTPHIQSIALYSMRCFVYDLCSHEPMPFALSFFQNPINTHAYTFKTHNVGTSQIFYSPFITPNVVFHVLLQVLSKSISHISTSLSLTAMFHTRFACRTHCLKHPNLSNQLHDVVNTGSADLLPVFLSFTPLYRLKVNSATLHETLYCIQTKVVASLYTHMKQHWRLQLDYFFFLFVLACIE